MIASSWNVPKTLSHAHHMPAHNAIICRCCLMRRVQLILYLRCPFQLPKVPFQTRKCPKPSFGTQLKFEKISPGQETCGSETQTHFQTAAMTATFVAHPDSYLFLFFTCKKPRLVQIPTGERFTMRLDFLVANIT